MEDHERSREIMETDRIFNLCDLSSYNDLEVSQTFEILPFRHVSAQSHARLGRGIVFDDEIAAQQWMQADAHPMSFRKREKF